MNWKSLLPSAGPVPLCCLAALVLALGYFPALAATPGISRTNEALLRRDFRSGDETLHAFAPVAEATRYSIVKLNVDGLTVALATVVDTNGLALTKASELKKGKLTGWLATDKEIDVELLATAEDEDLALVQVKAKGLKPIQWATGDVTIGQWAITPGLGPTPHAVGIVSARPRKIRPQRAYIGVVFEMGADQARIADIMPGLGAEKAGVKSGDVVVAVNGNSVTNREQVSEILRDYREGQTVKLRIRRGDEQLDFDIGMKLPGPDQLGRNLDATQRASRLSGAVSQRAEGFEQAIQHDTVLQPWLCGGPLVNLEGKAIGLNIARAGRVATYALPASLVKKIFNDLRPKEPKNITIVK